MSISTLIIIVLLLLILLSLYNGKAMELIDRLHDLTSGKARHDSRLGRRRHVRDRRRSPAPAKSDSEECDPV
jgi:hypothetical protein